MTSHVPDANYLTAVRPGVFRRLFKFTTPDDAYRLGLAYDMSHEHQTCMLDYSATPLNQACRDFQRLLCDEVLWESVNFRTDHATDSADGRKVASLTAQQRHQLSVHREHIRHLILVTDFYLLQEETCSFLLELLAHGDGHGSSSLQSFSVHVQEDECCGVCKFQPQQSAVYGYFQRPSWSCVMDQLEGRGVAVSLNVLLCDPCQSTEHYGKMYRVPRDDAFCRHLTALEMCALFPAENALEASAGPDMAPLPSVAFVAKLPALQHLHISAFNLSPSLLDLLARRAVQGQGQALKTLTIMVDLDNELTTGPLQDLSHAAWRAVTEACPSLQVTCDVRGTGLEDFFLLQEASRKEELAAAAAVRHGALHLPVTNGLGSPPHPPGDHHAAGNGAEAPPPPQPDAAPLGVMAEPPTTVAGALLALLKSSVPLVCLTVSALTVDDLDEVVRRCYTFNRTLGMFACFTVMGQGGVDGSDVHLLAEGDFSMCNYTWIEDANSSLLPDMDADTFTTIF